MRGGPAYTLPIFPVAFFLHACSRCKLTVPMLLAIQPHASVFARIWPSIRSKTIFEVRLILAFVLPPISPCVVTLPMHQILSPIAFVLATICPIIGAESINHVILPLTLVLIAFSPRVTADPVLLSLAVISYECGPIRPTRLPLSMLNIFDPHPCIDSPI